MLRVPASNPDGSTIGDWVPENICETGNRTHGPQGLTGLAIIFSMKLLYNVNSYIAFQHFLIPKNMI